MTDFQRLEEIKNFLGMSYNKIADVVGLKGPQSFYDIKAKKCGISYDVASKLQEYFKKNLNKELNIQWLMTGEGTMLRADATSESREEAEMEETDLVRELRRQLEEERRKNEELQRKTDAQQSTINSMAKTMEMMMEEKQKSICG